MRIGINGYYLNTLYAGIGQYTINLLRSLSEIDKENKYYIFTPTDVEWDFPHNFKLKVIKPLPIFPKTFLNRFLWEEFQLGWEIKKNKIDVFHGLYQSLPRGSQQRSKLPMKALTLFFKKPLQKKKLKNLRNGIKLRITLFFIQEG